MEHHREAWSGRSVFILAAIGSAVGVGNIWRFPYVAYENGGGAFIIPYLFALLTAGIPFLFLDYALGHKFRGSPPLAFRRLHKRAETIGWWQVGICFVISVYYAVIVAWAIRYFFFSFNETWGDNPSSFFSNEFLHQTDEANVAFDFVPGVAFPLVVVWVLTLAVLIFGVQSGIGSLARLFVPLLIAMFVILVVRALFLQGAGTGLDAFFRPNWSALAHPTVWIAAYAQIFFSLSVAFGIMLTYSSYLGRKADLTHSGLVVAFSNSSFEILAGIGVFATLGYMANISGVAVNEVVSDGIGLAFIAFPAIMSTMPGGPLFGILFFGALVLAGFTSMISITQVVVAAIEDKFDIGRVPAVLGVGGASALISLLFLPTTTGLNILDVLDSFASNIGIVGVALVATVVIAWVLRRLTSLEDHLNSLSSVKLGFSWRLFIGVITPAVLAYMLIDETITRIQEGYEGVPSVIVNTFGWGAQILVIVVAVLLSFTPWRRTHKLDNFEPTKAGTRV
ncbi:sodium-dependent transporter [Rhodococcus sp. WMMA185]|uniref:sodium-dependent transporter n=1 Tax=Rhodococcus sp. WMMA185 TaxID=679318 RepID=UPI000878FBE8|nr:sodium-dependent transporter [Rhodococcus sp. WMMA185]